MSEGPDGRPAFGVKSAKSRWRCCFSRSARSSSTTARAWARSGPTTARNRLLSVLHRADRLRRGAGEPDLRARDPKEKDKTFVEVGQLKLVLAVLVPSALYVALIGWLGIYVASPLFIAFFMRWLGKYPWWKTAAVSVGNSVVFFLIFEVWFKIPLPKGPLENLLGSPDVDEIQSLLHGFVIALSLKNVALMFAGIILGVIIGVLPGLGGANGVAILLPLTFSMAQVPGGTTSAIILLSCIYWGALFGGAITSILFNIPGEPWSVATTFDGYPLAQKGRAGEALTAAFTSRSSARWSRSS
jgi:hypothetical protein